MPTPTAPTATATTRTPRRASRAAFARCLEPVDAETFLADYWKLGLPLLTLFGLVAVLLVPVIWSF